MAQPDAGLYPATVVTAVCRPRRAFLRDPFRRMPRSGRGRCNPRGRLGRAIWYLRATCDSQLGVWARRPSYRNLTYTAFMHHKNSRRETRVDQVTPLAVVHCLEWPGTCTYVRSRVLA